MEINITKFFNECAPMDYSASVAEIGNDAGRDTWQAATDDSSEYPMIASTKAQEAFKDYVESFGAWERPEIDSWLTYELNALFIQFVSGSIREADMVLDRFDWDKYEADENNDSRMFKGDDNQIYYYIGV